MKRLLLCAIFIGLTATSCSSDDDTDPVDTESQNIFLPLTAGNFWTYDVAGNGIDGRDSLYVSNDTVIDGLDYKKMRTLALPAGFYSGSMNKNAVRKSGSSVVMWGETGISFPGVTPIIVALDDFIIFRENATENDALSTVSGQSEQELQGYPITIQYNLKSTAGATMASYIAPNGITYTDVKVVKVAMNLHVFSVVDVAGVPVNFPLLQSQDVIVSNQYYVKNIGMVHAATTFSYNLEDLSSLGITLPIPQSMNELTTETIATFQAN